jgi:hypothetical protein
LERHYLVTGVRAESKEIVTVELLDDKTSVVPNVVKTVVFRLGLDDFAELGKPTANERVVVTITIEKPAPAQPPT